MTKNLTAGLLVVVALASTAVFAWHFTPHSPQIAVDFLLLLAIAGLFGASDVVTKTTRPFPRPQGADLGIVAVISVVFCVLWIPHFDNWRWAYTGDSVAAFSTVTLAARQGLERNLLSMHGVDRHFTYLQSLGFQGLMFVFEPDLFWHRMGKMLISLLGLLSVFWFCRVTIGRWWAVAITVSVAANFYLVRMSYISYGHIDSIFFCFNAFLLSALIWRRRDDTRLWVLAGVNAGVALYFTQTAWSGVGVSGLCLIGLALRHRLFVNLALCGTAFAICIIPVALQWTDFLKLISSQNKPNFAWDYLSKMMATVFSLPYDSAYTRQRYVSHGFMQQPFDRLYVGGVVLAALAIIPPVRRWLRLPRVVPALAGMLGVEIVLLTIMNNGYPSPSPNRTYHILPLQTVLAFPPLILVYNLISRWRPLRAIAVVAVAACVGTYIQKNADILQNPPDHLFGSKTVDGFIELHQRHPHKKAVYFVTHPAELGDFTPGALLNQSYEFSKTVGAAEAVTAEAVEEACSKGELVCCHRGGVCPAIRETLATLGRTGPEYPTVNSRELACFECNQKSPAPDKTD